MSFAFALLVSGSRHWNNHQAIEHCLARHDIVADGEHAPTLIHGDQKGLDRMAGKIARARSWNVIAVPAVPTTMGRLFPSDFHLRNERLVEFLKLFRAVDYACHVACFPHEDSRGTWDLHNIAKRAQFSREVIRG